MLLSKVGSAFDDQGVPIDFGTRIAMTIMLDDLAWWGELLAYGRANGELPPAAFRVRAAMAEAESAESSTSGQDETADIDDRVAATVTRSHG